MSRNDGTAAAAALANESNSTTTEPYQQHADGRASAAAVAYGQAVPGSRHLIGPAPTLSNVIPTTSSGTSFGAAGGATMNSGRPPPLGPGGPPLQTNGPPINSSVPLLSNSSQFNNGPPLIGGGPPKSGPMFNSGSSLITGTQLNNGPLTSRSPTNSGPLLTSRSPSSSLFNNGPPVTSGLSSNNRLPPTSTLPNNGPLSNSGPSLTTGLLTSNNRLPPTSTLPNSGSLSNIGPSFTTSTLSNTGQAVSSGPLINATSTQNSSVPPSNRPLLSTGPPTSGSLYTNGPPLTGDPLKNTGNSNSTHTGSLPSTNRPSFNNDPSQITRPSPTLGPAYNSGLLSSNRPPLNSDPSHTVRSPSNVTQPTYSSGLPPTSKSGLSNDQSQITGPPSSVGSVQTSSIPPISRPPLSINPQQIPGIPLSSNQTMTSNLPPSIGHSNTRPVVNSGPPLNTRPLLNSGPSLNNGPPLNNTGPLYNSGPPLSSPASTPSSTGPALNSIPTMQRIDPSPGLTQQFQNVNLSGPSAPYGYKTEAPPNAMPQMGSQAYAATNRPLDMRSPTYPNPYNQPMSQQQSMSVTKSGFNKIWGMESVDIIQCRNVLPGEKVEPPRIKLHQDLLDRVNCSSEIFRCTLTKIPESNSLLQKSRLPLGILIHPFKDLNHLPVIQCTTIVRCRSCRTYINPFVYFVDSKRWKCNLCYKVNELPDEFQFDPATKSYGDPSRRPEIRTSTIEFIAPSEYMLRPPQPAVYLFIFDVSRLAVESGYLSIVCSIIAEEMSRLPGDGRTEIGFIAVDSAVHYFCMPENVSQPQHMIMMDVEDVFLPCPENLLVNLKEREELLKSLLSQLPHMFKDSYDTGCALGAALQAAYKLMSPTGGRVSVFQTCLPTVGPGALQPREDPGARAGKEVAHLNPATDFYKRLALDCSGQQVAVDLFLLNCQYSDLASLSGVCKFSGGCIYNQPLFQASKPAHAEQLERSLRRYLTRKIGFEAVMRIRCTRGLGIHTFHGNFFVRSTDLLSLPNVNPDAGFGMQVTIEESLSDAATVCFQAALLYTSSRGERRIRVHTLCLPTTANLAEVLYSADQQCILGLLAKMAVDRSIQSSLLDAREALINAVVDALSAYKLLQAYPGAGLLAPNNLKLLPMYIIALLKCRAFRFGVSTRLDDRFYAMCQLKTLPLGQLIQFIYPDLYAVHDFVQQPVVESEDGQISPYPERLHLSAEKLDSRGAFILDHCDQILLYVGKNIHPLFCYNVLGVSSFAAIPEEMWGLPELATPESERLRLFVTALQDDKPYYATLQVIRDDGHFRTQFTERLIEDRFENALSYYEFLQHVKTQVK